MFLFYRLFGLRLPTLEFVGYWVELGLGVEMRNSVRPHSMNIPLGLRFSVSPVVWTWNSHHRSFHLTPGSAQIKILQAAWGGKKIKNKKITK